MHGVEGFDGPEMSGDVVEQRNLDGQHHEAFVQGFSAAVTVNAAIAVFAAVPAALTLLPYRLIPESTTAASCSEPDHS